MLRRSVFRRLDSSDIFASFSNASERVLVLNRSYLPVHITTLKRAVALLYLEAAQGVDQNYQTYSWQDLEEGIPETELLESFFVLRTVNLEIAVPKVIVLREYESLPQRHLRFSRQHIFLRDNHTCQYCAKNLPKNQLNLDHVLPRSRGGKTNWENIVTSCHSCNRRKGNRTPHEAKMPLVRKPRRPSGNIGLVGFKKVHPVWSNFILAE